MTNFVVEVDGISCDYCGLKPSEYKDGCVLRYPDGSGGCGYIRDEIERLRAERDDAVKRMQDGWIEVCQATFPPLFEKLRAERDEAVRRLAEAERLLHKTNYYLAKWYPDLASEIYAFLAKLEDQP